MEQIQNEFLLKLAEEAIKQSNLVDPHNKLEEKHITLQFVVKNSQHEVLCNAAGCHKLPNGNCLCVTTHAK